MFKQTTRSCDGDCLCGFGRCSGLEHCSGGPISTWSENDGESGVDLTESWRHEYWLRLSAMNESNKLLEKFGTPQEQHIQEVFDSSRYWQTPLDIAIQSLWYHNRQMSQATALSVHLTALAHTWHGYFTCLGPGFDSVSEAWIISRAARYNICNFI